MVSLGPPEKFLGLYLTQDMSLPSTYFPNHHSVVRSLAKRIYNC